MALQREIYQRSGVHLLSFPTHARHLSQFLKEIHRAAWPQNSCKTNHVSRQPDCTQRNLVALPSSAMGAANVKPCGININEHFPYTVPVQAVIKDFRTSSEKGRGSFVPSFELKTSD